MKFRFVYFLILGVLIFTACEKEEFTNVEVGVPIATELSIKDGILQFNNWKEFYQKLDELNKMEISEFEAIEAQSGFNSFHTNYQDFQKEYLALSDNSDTELSIESQLKALNDLDNKYHTAVLVNFDDGGVYLKENIYERMFMRIVTHEGLVTVNNETFKFDINGYRNIDSRLKNPDDNNQGLPGEEEEGIGGNSPVWVDKGTFVEVQEFGNGRYKLYMEMKGYANGTVKYHYETYRSITLGVSWTPIPVNYNVDLLARGLNGQTVTGGGAAHIENSYRFMDFELSLTPYNRPNYAWMKMIVAYYAGKSLFRNCTVTYSP